MEISGKENMLQEGMGQFKGNNKLSNFSYSIIQSYYIKELNFFRNNKIDYTNNK